MNFKCVHMLRGEILTVTAESIASKAFEYCLNFLVSCIRCLVYLSLTLVCKHVCSKIDTLNAFFINVTRLGLQNIYPNDPGYVSHIRKLSVVRDLEDDNVPSALTFFNL